MHRMFNIMRISESQGVLLSMSDVQTTVNKYSSKTDSIKMQSFFPQQTTKMSLGALANQLELACNSKFIRGAAGDVTEGNRKQKE